LKCAPPLLIASGINEKSLKREGVCAASLPTTMAMIAALLIQNALKYLLGFGEIAFYQGYNALKDFFPANHLRPNPECAEKDCVKAQNEKRVYLKKVEEPIVEDTGPVHSNTEELAKYGISVVRSSAHDEKPKVSSDFVREFEAPVKPELKGNTVKVDHNDIDELQNMLKNTFSKGKK